MPITYRRATLADSRLAFDIFYESLNDFGRRINVMAITDGDDPLVLDNLWPNRQPLFDHLAETAENFWVAEDAETREALGYARTIMRDGCRELTEFFIRPGHQSGGVGRELLTRAFPRDGAYHRVIIATIDARAQALYLKSGVYPRFPIYYFARRPEPVSVPTDLTIEPITETPEIVQTLRQLDVTLFGHRRDIDLAWLLNTRTGFLYRRAGEPVGYGFTGEQRGPFALLDANDFPAVLAHAETHAHSLGLTDFGFEVPLINEVAVQYLLGRGYQMDAFFAVFMSDKPFGKFENYIVTSPPFFF
jgi:GNAT superfamily N-acetyltransferase